MIQWRSFYPEAVTLGAMVACLVLFHFLPWDLQLQDALFRSGWFGGSNAEWPIQKATALPRLLLYKGPKIGLYIGGVSVMALVAASFTRYASSWSKKNRRVLIILLLSLVLVPASAGIGKQLTHVHCPWDLTRYGGKVPYVTILEHPPHGTESIKRGVCFPAGHASGGFALMSLYFVFSDRRKQWIGLWFGIACGWIMGAYQMLVGAHFLSHTIFMMLQAWFVILLIARCANSKTALVPPTKTEPDNRV